MKNPLKHPNDWDQQKYEFMRRYPDDPTTIALRKLENENSATPTNFMTPVYNTNTISSDLKRTSFAGPALQAFKRRIARVNIFTTQYNAVPLQGADTVSVPFYDLETASSTNFSSSYSTGNTTTDAKKVTINKRKYQAMSWTSSEFCRQPNLKTPELIALKADKLGYDVWTDVLSAVVAATYTNVVTTPIGAFDGGTIADIKKACDDLNWPANDRALILNTSYDNALMKDSSFRMALALGEQALVNGEIPKIMGFTYVVTPNFPNNSENLAGIAVHKSALAVAFSPIKPSDEVQSQLTTYEVATDPDSGVTLELRRWGTPDTDTANAVIESNYGYVAGNPNAIVRLATA